MTLKKSVIVVVSKFAIEYGLIFDCDDLLLDQKYAENYENNHHTRK